MRAIIIGASVFAFGAFAVAAHAWPPPVSTPPVGQKVEKIDKGYPKTGTGTSMDAATSWGGDVNVITVEKGKRVEVDGSLDRGMMTDYAAPKSCMSDGDKAAFKSNTVLYGFTLPADTDVKISVLPND